MSVDNKQINGDVTIGRNAAMGGNATIQGNATIGHNLKVNGWLDARNIKGANKGIFMTATDLEAAYANPENGWFAGVGSSSPFALYVGMNGEWVNTGGTFEITADLSRVTALEDAVATQNAYLNSIKDLLNELQEEMDFVTITTEVNDSTMGSVIGGGTHVVGHVITLTAIANNGYQFVQWSDGNTNASRTFTVTEAATYRAIFSVMSYRIDVEVQEVEGETDPRGTASIEGTGEYGSTMQASASANSGFKFLGWYDENDTLVSTANPFTFPAEKSETLTAKFVRDEVTLTFEYDEHMGKIYVGEDLVDPSTKQVKVEQSVEVTITAQALEGHTFAGWVGGTTDPIVIAPAEDMTFNATFEVNTYTLAVHINDATLGNVTKTPSADNDTYDYGTVVRLTPAPFAGNEFVRWSDGSTANPRDVTMNSNIELTATFRVIPARDYYVGYVNINDISDFQALTKTALQNASTGYLLENTTQYSGNVPSGMTCMFMMVKSGVAPTSGRFVSDGVPTDYSSSDFQDTDIFDMTHDPVTIDDVAYNIIGVLNPLFKSTDTFTINFA